MYRLFVAIDLPSVLKQQLSLLSGGVPGARWLEPPQMHLTIRFIGEVDGGVFRDVQEVLAEVRSDPIELILKGMGHFPPRKKPEQIWVGIAPSERLSILHHRIDTALAKIGLPRDGRKFAPHVTIAHLRAAKDHRVAEFLAAYNLYESAPFVADEFCLYSSQLSSHGAYHEIEATYPLHHNGGLSV
ncbi:MAG: RNA 2',3'-cyclic phosphodiesterase [Candidatus Zixiibacteriota bacterium]